MALPLLQLRAARATERQVMQPRAALGKKLGAVQVREMVNTHQRPSHRPHHVMKRTSVLINNRRIAEQASIPRTAPTEVADRPRHVGYGRGIRDDNLYD